MFRFPSPQRLSFFCLSLAGIGLAANPINADPPRIEAGRILEAREKIGRIARVTVTEDGKLKVDRSRWEKLAAESDENQWLAELIQMHLREQVPVDVAQRMAEQTIERAAMNEMHPVMRLFAELKTALGIGSGGSSRSGRNLSLRGNRGDTSALLNLHDDAAFFRLSIVQMQPTFQSLQIDDHAGNGFRFSWDTSELTLLFCQRADGSIVATYASDDEKFAFSADSFDVMRSEHAEFYQRFTALMKELGIFSE